jgi:hypothetical protein
MLDSILSAVLGDISCHRLLDEFQRLLEKLAFVVGMDASALCRRHQESDVLFDGEEDFFIFHAVSIPQRIRKNNNRFRVRLLLSDTSCHPTLPSSAGMGVPVELVFMRLQRCLTTSRGSRAL